jgi:hypothetical protein
VYPDEVPYDVQGADKTLFFTRDGITFRLQGNDRVWVVYLEFVVARKRIPTRAGYSDFAWGSTIRHPYW